MNISRIHRFTLAAIFTFAVAGLMQAGEQCTFHLSSETRWGQAVLPPGDYRIYVPAIGETDRTVRVEGANKAVFEVPRTVTHDTTSDSSYLKLSEVNGMEVVREFSYGPQGKTFSFPAPRETRNLNVAKNSESTSLLAVR